jgi:NACHT domain
MEYYFSHLDPVSFQRLVNAILVGRFGENLRLTPLRGADDGKDAETAPGNPYFRFDVTTERTERGLGTRLDKGRYLFQVKHHRTIDTRLSDARNAVVSDFRSELVKNVLNRTGDERANHFYLITNVPASRDSLAQVDSVRRELLATETNLHADVWWSERLVAFLDQMPSLWPSFPDLFAGRKVPILPEIISGQAEGLPKVIRMAIDRQYKRDSFIKFRQIELENSLSQLFIDLDVSLEHLSAEEIHQVLMQDRLAGRRAELPPQASSYGRTWGIREKFASALGLLLDESSAAARRVILEGGPGQGKSTVTQMIAQIYRDIVLDQHRLSPEGRWRAPKKVRLPLRMELRDFAEWLIKNTDGSVEQHLASLMKKETGGSNISVDQIHALVENSPVLLIFDGLDEVGSEESRDAVIKKIVECIDRFETNLHVDLRIILTTRPPAIAGRREQLPEFRRFPITPLTATRVGEFVKRWVAFQLQDTTERLWVKGSFEKRENEVHVKALATNPMQLSVLLHFIRLKGEAFPDRRVELYREYFKTVIDRDVEKSAELRQNRDTIDVLHQLIGYKIHSLTEAKRADGTLTRSMVLELVEDWIEGQGGSPNRAQELFKIGEERLGLIIALKGEGEDAVYGFEIQPIREYFAAAFISDQIQGNAHAVFEELLRRSYWREVALFLAGLRRANEKADLVTRSKPVDQDTNLGWRQDGRAMMLQLLQEGALSQPPHVYNEALDFVMDLLDPTTVPVQSQPKGLLQILPTLIKQGEARRHIDRILGLVEKFSTSDDEYVLFQLYSVLSELLDDDSFGDAIFQYAGDCENLLANLRLRWPTVWRKNVSHLSERPTYWSGVSDALWAEALWDSFLDSQNSTVLSTPVHLHQLLAEQFASNPRPIAITQGPSVFIRDEPTMWTLARLQNELLNSRFLKASPKHKPSEWNGQLNLSGLEQTTAETIAELTKGSDRLVRSLHGGEVAQKEALSNYLTVLRDRIHLAGIDGWITCRCVTNLLQITMSAEFNLRRRRESPDAYGEVILKLRDSSEWFALTKATGKLFNTETANLMTQFRQTSVAYAVYEEYVALSVSLVPTHARVKSYEPPVEIVKLLAENICHNTPLPFEWLSRIPITRAMIRPLVEATSDCLPELLRFLSRCRLSRHTAGAPLMVQQMQRILRIAKTSDDSEVLAGALVALLDSTFLQVAKSELIEKMLAAERTDSKAINSLFNPTNTDPHMARSKDIFVIDKLARKIIQDHEKFPFRTVTESAAYVAEHEVLNQQPLMLQEQALGLFFQKTVDRR